MSDLSLYSDHTIMLLAANIFLPAIIDFDAMNGVYDAWIEARLADPDLAVEMTAVAAL
jgi:enamine deaminase RidA (YjgF/YER057c/UK114 family)